MAATTIRLLTEADLAVYRALLMSGLEQDADSFRIAPEDEQHAPFPTQNRPDSFTMGAFVGEQLAGVVSFQRDGAERVKLRHKGLLFRMYVSPNVRGQGLAGLLIQEVIDRARQLDGLEQLVLTVTTTNPAKRIYERFGFRSFSLEENAMKWRGTYLTEEAMKLML
ncbi:GNAT family N-acetyltransferase [Fibrella forsythiae]|uniref:GNAT family N-acetyltransferase n=1 Tax=Fibrella forsythiae TaxID=2817061 RepID=A0ABS3JNB8_9BACT|nr:GNAT family N-acetyltransferase [Fibrella forsythiae]MBO0951505.1 GNAT family N-acetyltransferase [Fibrella forsythiae]